MTNRIIAAQPNGHWIRDFSVSRLSENSLKLKMAPANCGYNIPLVSVEGVPRRDDDGESTFNFTAIDATITVKRDKAASPPLRGTFDITFENKTIKGTA